MNLRQLIFSGLTANITGTSKIFYNQFPDAFRNEMDSGLIFFINNPSNENSFDKKEFLRVENVDFVVRSPSLDRVENIRDEIKAVVYNLERTRYIAYSLLVSEDQPIWDDSLKCWESFISLDLSR